MNATDKMTLHNLQTQYGLGLELTPWEIAELLRLQAREHRESESGNFSDISLEDPPGDRSFLRECESLQEWQKASTS
jgi:hypothetical protein